jgi:hypothetical protein
MDDDGDFLGIIILILSLCLWANTGRDVWEDQIEAAARVCEPHGGTKWIDGNVLQQAKSITTEIGCKDGTRITTVVRRAAK